MIQERPGQIEFLGDMVCERFHTNCLSRVVTSVENIQPQLFRVEVRPVLSVARDVRVEPGSSGLRNQRTPSARHNADALDPLRTEGQQTWRAAEKNAGVDPTVSDKEFADIMNLHAIRKAVAKYRLKNERPPTLRHIASLPANPITGQKTVTRTGIATEKHGWSYDEYSGRVRIVLPDGKYAGLGKDEIEFVKARR